MPPPPLGPRTRLAALLLVVSCGGPTTQAETAVAVAPPPDDPRAADLGSDDVETVLAAARSVEPGDEELTAALEDALGRASDDGAGNRVRVEILRALGRLEARQPLERAVLDDSLHFLLGRMALDRLAEMGSLESLDTFLLALFLWDEGNPAFRMNDLAVLGLVRLGRDALPALRRLLQSPEPSLRALVRRYVEATQLPLEVESVIAQEVVYAIGEIGEPAVAPVLVEELNAEDPARRLGAAVALVRLGIDDAETIRAALSIHDSLEARESYLTPMMRAQHLAAMRRFHDPLVLELQRRVLEDDDASLDVRIEAAKGILLLATVDELQATYPELPEDVADAMRDTEAVLRPLLARCDDELGCYRAVLTGTHDDPDRRATEVEKATVMIARLGVGDEASAAALVPLLSAPDLRVRLSAAEAIDAIAVHGSADAVAAIEDLREREVGRSIWSSFQTIALPLRARLIRRGR